MTWVESDQKLLFSCSLNLKSDPQTLTLLAIPAAIIAKICQGQYLQQYLVMLLSCPQSFKKLLLPIFLKNPNLFKGMAIPLLLNLCQYFEYIDEICISNAFY
jgi:hypothetical protein